MQSGSIEVFVSGVGLVTFKSPDQARSLALALFKKAHEAESSVPVDTLRLFWEGGKKFQETDDVDFIMFCRSLGFSAADSHVPLEKLKTT